MFLVKGRGNDPEYCAARLIQYLTNAHDKMMAEYKEPQYTGYGVSSQFHGDIEYYYAVCQGVVTVYECCGEPKDWKKLGEIRIGTVKKDLDKFIKKVENHD